MSAVGSSSDIVVRLRAALPQHWFGDDAPVLGAVLGGFGAVWAQLYDVLQTVRRQSRIGTADGAMLDLIAGDFFGSRLMRRPGQGDAAFRGAILRELLRERATRQALASALTDLTGTAPRIFEPTRPADTGAWGGALGYGAAGGWGSLALPFQCFVQVRRPSGQGIAGVEGYEALRSDGLISARAVSSRSTAGSYVDASGTLQFAPANVLRFDWSGGAPRLLVEAASTNAVRNPRAEGAALGVIGAGGQIPTYWGGYTTAGLSREVTGFGIEAGVPYLELRVYGTTTGANAVVVVAGETTVGVVAATGQTWTASSFVRLVAGSLSGLSAALYQNELSAAGAYLAGTMTPIAPATGALPTQRFALTSALTNAGTGRVQALLSVTVPNAGTAVDFRLRIGGWQAEQAAAASSLMLPPIGSPMLTARSAETVSIPATLPGGYGRGAIEWASLAMVQGQVTDADIYDATARTMPAAAIAWTAISS